jgi:hypothetical protein
MKVNMGKQCKVTLFFQSNHSQCIQVHLILDVVQEVDLLLDASFEFVFKVSSLLHNLFNFLLYAAYQVQRSVVVFHNIQR